MRTSVMAVASCLALSGLPLSAGAAGLGKIVVFSALGQPLRAEIEISATREELSGMKAQLSPPEAFKQAGLEYATTLLGIRFNLDKRANGQSIIKLSSDKPINDPFVDMLLELNWPAGRLVREYTFLLDPPEIAAKESAPVAPAMVSSVAAASQPPAAVRAPAASIDDEVRSKAVARVRAQEAVQKPAEQPAEGRNVREVKRGDTLSKIASATKPEGVSLEQMLVGLLRANQEAFDGGNMNRLKAGRILSLPEKSAIEAVSTGEARKVVVAQSADWNAYRSKLAAVAAQAPVKEGAAKQEAAGKITAKVEDKATPAAEQKDQLKVSKTDTASIKSGSAAKSSEEDLIAKEKALKEAKERLTTLEKNVSDLEKLVALKNQNLAELQKQAAAKAVSEAKPQVPPPTPVPVPVASPAKVEPIPTVPAAVEKPAVKPADTQAPEPVAKPEEVKPEPKPEAKPVAAPKAKPVPPPPPPEEPGFVEELLDNPLALAGGGGILALLAAYFVARRRRADKGEVPLDLNSTLSPHSESLTANSVFRSTGGQSVDTSHTPVQTDFSQAGPGSIDTDEVDPVAEADVYMAYGRDAQAEEILLEAKQKDPKRYAIHLKLLEIYSNRKNTKQFEMLATDLYSETGGVGADWEKAAAMGLKLDPTNPLFSSSAPPVAPPPFDANATVIVTPQSMRSTVSLPGELSQLAEVASASELQSAPVAAFATEESVPADLTSLDFDLGLGDAKPAATPENAKPETKEAFTLPKAVVDAGALDFDLATSKSTTSGADATVVGLDFNMPEASTSATFGAGGNEEVADLDFDVGTGSSSVDIAEVQTPTQSRPNAVQDIVTADDGVKFDVKLTESTILGSSMPEPSSFDMSSIDLDLKVPELEIPASVSPPMEEADSASRSAFDRVQVSTSVNPDFAAMQSETLVNPPFSIGSDFDSERDFATAQAETKINPQVGVESDLSPEFENSVNEEVTTKLDLAKAYEEMGDFEGARELLQEVLKEGNTTQRETAQVILAKIGA